MIKIYDILRAKGDEVISLPPDSTVRELIATLAERRIGAVIVVDGTELRGVVSERDVVRRLHTDGDTVLDTELVDLMSSDVVSCGVDDDIDAIAATMTERRIRHMPVLRGDTIVGVVSIGDVVKSRMEQLQNESDQLTHYITG
jgi:CBS domain-containing protein